MLQHASEALRADKEVVLAAVAQDGDALEHASEALKVDREVVLAAKGFDNTDREAVLAAVASLSVFFLALSYLPMMALQYFFVADAVRQKPKDLEARFAWTLALKQKERCAEARVGDTFQTKGATFFTVDKSEQTG